VDDGGYFDERAAAKYDESGAEMVDPAVVDLQRAAAGRVRALDLRPAHVTTK
jgi:hypothetical protein